MHDTPKTPKQIAYDLASVARRNNRAMVAANPDMIRRYAGAAYSELAQARAAWQKVRVFQPAKPVRKLKKHQERKRIAHAA